MFLHRHTLRAHLIELLLSTCTLVGIVTLETAGSAVWADVCAQPTNGPTGSDASAFTYQCAGTYAGEWISAYYLYSPETATETPLYTITYSYNCTTDIWTQNDWQYDSGSRTYIENWVPTTTNPDEPTNCTDTSTTSTSADIGNTSNSSSQSGNATVAGNGDAGDATSGDASTEVTDTNLVDSASSTTGSNVATFTTDVGNVNGDLVLDPSTMPTSNDSTSSQPAALSSTTTDASISNTITATAASGNATVAGNGDAGDATSGDASTIVNLINLINSAVAAGQSFIGTININGDLNGNILIPQSFVDQLLASNGGTQNTTDISNESIINNINAAAASGNATVAGNYGEYGSATTGSANTNITILNLTGSSVIGKNVLLVFVNVLGSWTGLILNAPAGTTSAEFGGGITSNTSSSGTNTSTTASNLSITNNVNASATTGTALVADNQDAGNATSGDADTGVNILNIQNSDLSLANWFGILFINVFGTWSGNFEVMPTSVSSNSSNTSNLSNTPTTPVGNDVTQSDSTPNDAARTQFATYTPSISDNAVSTPDDNTAILGDATTAPVGNLQPTTHSNTISRSKYLLPLIGLCSAALILTFSERDRFTQRDKK
jgi:hypothetical protein